MASHNVMGKEGEALAEAWLTKNGYTILHRNWRFSHYEIDIIALKEDMLRIVEVKARTSIAFGNPEDSVTKKKFTYLKRAATAFLRLYPQYKWMQYDVLSITLGGKEPAYFLLEDVFL